MFPSSLAQGSPRKMRPSFLKSPEMRKRRRKENRYWDPHSSPPQEMGWGAALGISAGDNQVIRVGEARNKFGTEICSSLHG